MRQKSVNSVISERRHRGKAVEKEREQRIVKNRVDVVIPVYNGERFIRAALASAANQTYPPNRIIVVNDGSTDNTEEITRSYSSKIPISCLNKRNGGPSSARNVGIAASKSDFLSFLDCDDVWEPEKLEKQMALFRNSQFEGLGIVYCGALEIGGSQGAASGNATHCLSTKNRGDVFERLINFNIAGNGSTVLVKRTCFETSGLFDENLRLCEDWDMWLRIAEHYQFDFVDEPLVGVRCHNSNASANTDGMIAGRIIVLAKLLKNHPDNQAILQELRYHILRLSVHRGLKLRRGDLREYLEEEAIGRLLSDFPGMVRACVKGVAKMAKRLVR